MAFFPVAHRWFTKRVLSVTIFPFRHNGEDLKKIDKHSGAEFSLFVDSFVFGVQLS